MKKSIFSALLIIVALAFTSISCKSAPPPAQPTAPEQPTPAPEPPKPPADTGLDQARERAEKARQRAEDFEAPSYFPSDWETLEEQYAAAADMPESNADEIQQKITSYNTTADAYDELFKKTIPLYAQAREDEIMAVRDELIHAGFADVFPQFVQKADKLALTALEQYEAEDYYTARDTADAALSEYETLLSGAKVYLTRREIIDRGFRDYDPDNFDKADDIAQAAIDAHEAGDTKATESNVEEAQLRYNLVLANGWVVYASERRSSASAERERALDNKVNIASRDLFREADSVFNLAEDNFKINSFEDAAIFFTEAEALFAVAGKDTADKRQRAIETIRLAEERIEEIVETATEAERIIEGGSR